MDFFKTDLVTTSLFLRGSRQLHHIDILHPELVRRTHQLWTLSLKFKGMKNEVMGRIMYLHKQVADVLVKDNEFPPEFLLFLNKQEGLLDLLLEQQKDEKQILLLCEL